MCDVPTRLVRHTPQSSSPGLTGRPSIPETPVIEPRSRGVLDTPLARGMTTYRGRERGANPDFVIARSGLSAVAQPAKAEATKQSRLRHSGMVRSTRPQMRNCASGNLEIPGSMLRIAPE